MNRNLRRRGEQDANRRVDRAVGAPAALTRFSAKRSADRAIQNVGHLPCQLQNALLQNAEGDFYYLPGYSDPAVDTIVGSPTMDSTSGWSWGSSLPTLDHS
jgi:hypothetical protein